MRYMHYPAYKYIYMELTLLGISVCVEFEDCGSTRKVEL